MFSFFVPGITIHPGMQLAVRPTFLPAESLAISNCPWKICDRRRWFSISPRTGLKLFCPIKSLCTQSSYLFLSSAHWWFRKLHVSHDTTKPQNECTPSEVSDQPGNPPSRISFHCLHEENLVPKLSTERTAKTLIRLGGCLGWSESSLCAHSCCGFCHVMAHVCVCVCVFLFVFFLLLLLFRFRMLVQNVCMLLVFLYVGDAHLFSGMYC